MCASIKHRSVNRRAHPTCPAQTGSNAKRARFRSRVHPEVVGNRARRLRAFTQLQLASVSAASRSRPFFPPEAESGEAGSCLMPFGNSIQRSRASKAPAVPQSQRDCVCQPRVARNELPWVAARSVSNPDEVVSRFHGLAATPLGLFALAAMSQGSSFLATLGFWLESLWDSTYRICASR